MTASCSAGGFCASLVVELGDRSYRVHAGPGLLPRAGDLIREAVAASRCFVITNPVVDRIYGDRLRQGLDPLAVETVLVPGGERQKSLRQAAQLYDQLLAAGAARNSLAIAFGGGVIGDLAGFVAATYMRGLPYVQVPTTLVAQVDASVGGKVAVNHPRAKNLIGAFYQPCLVIADSEVLRTLSARDYRCGLAEVVKHAVIADAELFAWLEAEATALGRRDALAIAHSVRRSCEIKAEVVGRDEREVGPRAALNLGHTVGHALESLGAYRGLRHGEAVSVGLVAAARVAVFLGLLGAEVAKRIEELLRRFRLPTRVPPHPVSDILAAMRSDKKAAAGEPRFVLPRALGAVEVSVAVPTEAVTAVLTSLGATGRLGTARCLGSALTDEERAD